MFNAKEFQIETETGKIPCISFGRGKKPLIMIPGLRLSGMEGAANIVAWYYRIFAKDYTVYIIDRKDILPEECTIHSLAEDVYLAMEKLGLKGAYIFGASQGGMIAQDLTINHPEFVSKLVLGVTMSRNNPAVESVIEHWIKLAEEKSIDDIAADYVYKGYSEKYIKRYKLFLPLLLKTQKKMPVERFIKLAKACLTCSTYDNLEKIKCPVLVLGGGKDKVVTGEASREIAEKLNCECFIYEDLSHEAYNEAKDFNMRIYNFFEEKS